MIESMMTNALNMPCRHWIDRFHGSLASTPVYRNSVLPCTDGKAADPERTATWAGQSFAARIS